MRVDKASNMSGLWIIRRRWRIGWDDWRSEELLNGIQEVRGSTPLGSTNAPRDPQTHPRRRRRLGQDDPSPPCAVGARSAVGRSTDGVLIHRREHLVIAPDGSVSMNKVTLIPAVTA